VPTPAARTLLFVQPSFNPPGGGNGVAAWMLEALSRDYACTLLTHEAPDFDAINRFYGTAIRGTNIDWRLAAPARYAVLKRVPFRIDLLKSSLLFAEATRISAGFDAVVTANNEADLGVPAVQYVHYPSRLYPRPDADLKWFHFRWLVAPYRALCARIHPAPRVAIARNVTLVNSQWCGAKMREAHGVNSIVAYPPVVWNRSVEPWHRRDGNFLTIGRLSPEKDFEKVMRILEQVRTAGHPVRLTIVATPDVHHAYARRVRAAVAARRDWVSLIESLSRDALEQLIARHRFGIHGMVEEHFGMAIAEMSRAGTIVFVHDSGGQPEIVGHDPRLCYTSEDDAAAKIVCVLNDPDQQSALSDHVRSRAEAFNPDRFMQVVRDAVQTLTASTR